MHTRICTHTHTHTYSHTQKDLHMIVHSSFIYSNPQTGNNQNVPQQTVVHPYHGIRLSCYIPNNLDGSQGHYAK